jgi:hypothetical protein
MPVTRRAAPNSIHVILKMDMELQIEQPSGPEALADIASQ